MGVSPVCPAPPHPPVFLNYFEPEAEDRVLEPDTQSFLSSPVLWEINNIELHFARKNKTHRPTERRVSRGQFRRGPPALRPHTTPPSQRRKNAARLPSVNTSTEYSLARETSHQYSAEPGGHLRTGQ
jgi:hypothetical protein